MQCCLEFNCKKIILLNILNMPEGYVIFLSEIQSLLQMILNCWEGREKNIMGVCSALPRELLLLKTVHRMG